MTKLIRVSEEAYSKISDMAKSMGFSRQELIDEALKKLEREFILKRANESYLATRENPQSQKEERNEIDIWDNTIDDGLDNE